MAYIEKIGPEQVLEAMRALGWEPGKRPPTYVDIQQKCRALFGNGGDGNRIKSLREQAIALALRESGAPSISIADANPPTRLPEELQDEVDGLANDVSKRLTAFDRAAATYLDRCRANAEATANARVMAIRKESTEQAAAFEEEITAALSAMESRDVAIADLGSRLSAAITAAAHAEGRASALTEQVSVQADRIAELEKELKQKSGSKPPAPKQPAAAAKPAAKNAGKVKKAAMEQSDTAAEPGNDSSGNTPAVQDEALVGGVV